MITRCDFIGFNMPGGPNKKTFTSYSIKDSSWKGWTVEVSGPVVVFQGEGRRIEVPRALCMVQMDLTAPAPVIETKASKGTK